jgi:primosomal protein N' (replication factor Y)
VCVLNRTGRARLLACRSCGTLAECERCGSSVHQDDRRMLVCTRCGIERPGVCLECGSSAMSLLRLGVGRAGEELEALVQEPVATVTAAGGESEVPRDVRVLVGTEAVLHRVASADLVAFLDMDQELFAPRYRAAEEALSLLVMANRVLGGRGRGGRLVVQTRAPEHEVLQAALRADPRPVSEVEGARRRLLRFPPAATLAVLGSDAAEEYVARVGAPLGIDVLGPDEGRWMLRSDDPERLWDHLAGVERPPGRLRLQVDPSRIR